jgi:DNA-binding FadR family transcriptional regulator
MEVLPVRPVRRAHEQVADQLRELVLGGRLVAGDRLPTESELCVRFGVSRGTVREALRTLTTEGLVTTTRGASGGTFVATPQPVDVVHFLTGTISLLAVAREVSVAELLQAREVLEVEAARQAAAHRSPADLERLRSCLRPARGFAANRAFHDALLEAAPNRLLPLLTAPLFGTLQNRFLRDRATPRFWSEVAEDHARIAAAVEAGDADAAGRAMRAHLHNLRPTYERIDGASRGEQVS